MRFILLLLFICCAVASNLFVVELKQNQTPQAWQREHPGIHYVRKLNLTVGNFHLFKFTDEEHFERMVSSNGGDFIERQVHRKQFHRYSDPLYNSQWHLHGPSSYSVEVHSAWDSGLMGSNVKLTIVDDGLQHDHPDLHTRYDASRSKDYNGHDDDPYPNHYNAHGTSAAGVAAAECNNAHCGCGAAPRVSLAGIRLIAAAVADYQEAEALLYAHDKTDIYSNSWGPYDGGDAYAAPGYITQQALKQGAKQGRGGKGNIYVWAAGNGRHYSDSCNYDGYANSIYTIAIGAIDSHGHQSWYSEGCAALVAVAPSNGVPGRGIRTTDLKGAAGYDSGECTTDFGGTSSAAPLAAGVIALLLEENPALSWRDVQNVIALGAKKLEVDNVEWSINNRGYKHSDEYGFGLMHVPSLRRALATYTLLPPARTPLEAHGLMPHFAGALDFVEHVELEIITKNTYHGKVNIKVHSPNGVVSTLATPHHENNSYGAFAWRFSSMKHWGEHMPANSTWTIDVSGTGPIQSTKLIVHGH